MTNSQSKKSTLYNLLVSLNFITTLGVPILASIYLRSNGFFESLSTEWSFWFPFGFILLLIFFIEIAINAIKALPQAIFGMLSLILSPLVFFFIQYAFFDLNFEDFIIFSGLFQIFGIILGFSVVVTLGPWISKRGLKNFEDIKNYFTIFFTQLLFLVPGFFILKILWPYFLDHGILDFESGIFVIATLLFTTISEAKTIYGVSIYGLNKAKDS